MDRKNGIGMLSRLTVCVCTYNEERNIIGCIDSIKKNGITNILVVDASTDNTKKIVENEGGVVLSAEKGLARQRQIGIDACTTEYLAFVDADDRLDADCMERLLQEMEQEHYDAIQASVRVYKPCTYWEKAIDATWRYCVFRVGSTNMIGRPAIYRTASLRDAGGADINFINIGDEDTAISIRMEKKGYKQGIGTGISYRKCHNTFSQNKKEWIKYGKGDAMVIQQYPEKKRNIYKHLLINYPVKRSWELIKNGAGIYCLYPICIGITRFWVMKKTRKA